MSWFPKQTVVVPVDFSDHSLAAVKSALSLVDAPSHLHVIHVGGQVVTGDPGLYWDPLDEATRREQITQALSKQLAGEVENGIQLGVRFGDPGREIASFAEKLGAELIVMPSHGRSGLKRLLIGSVAERVTRLAHCPVLILKD